MKRYGPERAFRLAVDCKEADLAASAQSGGSPERATVASGPDEGGRRWRKGRSRLSRNGQSSTKASTPLGNSSGILSHTNNGANNTPPGGGLDAGEEDGDSSFDPKGEEAVSLIPPLSLVRTPRPQLAKTGVFSLNLGLKSLRTLCELPLRRLRASGEQNATNAAEFCPVRTQRKSLGETCCS